MTGLLVILVLGIGMGSGAHGNDFLIRPVNRVRKILFRCEAKPGRTAPTGMLEGYPTGGLPEAFEILERTSGWFIEIQQGGQVTAKFELAEVLEVQAAHFDLFSAKQKNNDHAYVHVYRGENGRPTVVNFGLVTVPAGQISLGKDYLGVSTEDGFDCERGQ